MTAMTRENTGERTVSRNGEAEAGAAGGAPDASSAGAPVRVTVMLIDNGDLVVEALELF